MSRHIDADAVDKANHDDWVQCILDVEEGE